MSVSPQYINGKPTFLADGTVSEAKRIGHGLVGLDLDIPEDREKFDAVLCSLLTGKEGRFKKSYNDGAGYTTVGKGFNMDRPEARKEWNAAFAGRSNPPDFDKVYRGEQLLTDAQIDRLFIHGMEFREKELDNLYRTTFRNIERNSPEMLAPAKMVLMSLYFNGPSITRPSRKVYAGTGDSINMYQALKHFSQTGNPADFERFANIVRGEHQVDDGVKRGIMLRRHTESSVLLGAMEYSETFDAEQLRRMAGDLYDAEYVHPDVIAQRDVSHTPAVRMTPKTDLKELSYAVYAARLTEDLNELEGRPITQGAEHRPLAEQLYHEAYLSQSEARRLQPLDIEGCAKWAALEETPQFEKMTNSISKFLIERQRAEFKAGRPLTFDEFQALKVSSGAQAAVDAFRHMAESKGTTPEGMTESLVEYAQRTARNNTDAMDERYARELPSYATLLNAYSDVCLKKPNDPALPAYIQNLRTAESAYKQEAAKHGVAVSEASEAMDEARKLAFRYKMGLQHLGQEEGLGAVTASFADQLIPSTFRGKSHTSSDKDTGRI